VRRQNLEQLTYFVNQIKTHDNYTITQHIQPAKRDETQRLNEFYLFVLLHYYVTADWKY
jgi:hypothetical protein